MLVLSRRPDETIVLPDIGVTVKVLGTHGHSVRIGLQAPRDIRIFRGEIDVKRSAKQGQNQTTHLLSRKEFHDLKNQLNALSLAIRLINKQRQAGMHEEADRTLNDLVGQLDQLCSNMPKLDQPTAPSSGFRALLVEDDDNERELLASLLRMSGYEVDTAGDGRQALAYLQSHERPDLVLLDMRMPRCDGPETIREIRKQSALNGLKVFAVSATSPQEFGVPAGTEGVDRWFPKPVNAEQLTHEIGSLASSCA